MSKGWAERGRTFYGYLGRTGAQPVVMDCKKVKESLVKEGVNACNIRVVGCCWCV